MGVGKGPLVYMMSALSLMELFLCTVYGESRTHYDGNAKEPFVGLGQVNGAGLADWLVVSSILLDYLRRS